MLFAAGLGTRLKPFTESHPKALFPVCGKPLLEHNLNYLKNAGIREVVINIHHFAEQIVQFLEKNDGFGMEIQFSEEKDQLLETGGGLAKAAEYLINEPYFLVMNADILTDISIADMEEHYLSTKPLASLAVSERNASRGLYFTEDNLLCGWENADKNLRIGSRGTGTKWSFSGVHIISNQIFECMPKEGVFSIMDTYLELMHTQPVTAYPHTKSVIDVGKPEALTAAEKFIQNQNNV